ncbi:caspase family protein [Streptomyces cinnabarinus]|uniref:Caspase family protein n=1 Tax=Streptomyces cinnabarinus TaxID=67287 RepID=A0ABY7KT70_9ACTN|nr:caspase family protein [Streptomyces cinnabarinus]WAZ26592.1 caspase family protein [Streptomyces cinnabarinus]
MRTTVLDLAQALTERCGMPSDAVRTLLDPASPVELGDAIGTTVDEAEGLLVVYFVGHGLVDQSSVLHLSTACTDTRATRLSHTALPYPVLRQYALEFLNSGFDRSLVVVLDCCFSGRAVRPLGPGGVDDTVVQIAGVNGGYVLTSAGRDELALAPEGQRHTAFSGALLRLLDAGDRDGPAELSLDDVFRSLTRTLHAAQAPKPQRFVEGRANELILAPNPAYRATAAARRPDGGRAVMGASQVRPYKGLARFDVSDAAWFFGREVLTRTVVGRLARHCDDAVPLALIGCSGSGKSSLLRAGLIPALRQGELGIAGSATWPRLLLTPTADPLGMLAAAAGRLSDDDPGDLAARLRADPAQLSSVLRRSLKGQAGGRVVIIVDQFEELFTQCADAEDRRVFLEALCGAARGADGEPSALVVIGLRADFYEACLARPELVPSLVAGPVVVGAMTVPELRASITLPAIRAGLELEPGLVDLLLADLGVRVGDDDEETAQSYEAGRLPLLAHALLMAWQRRKGDALTTADYRRAEGIAGALSATAEGALHRLDEPAREAARILLLRLVQVGDGAHDTRRRWSRQRLLASLPDLARGAAVIEAFTAEDTRLLSVEQDSVEIVHETLLSAWPRLQAWITADRARLLAEQQLNDAAHAWEQARRDPELLFGGVRLELARRVTEDEGGPGALTSSARDFVAAALARVREEAAAALRRTRRRRTGLLAGGCVLVVLALVFGLLWKSSLEQEQRAERQHTVATAQGLVFRAESLRDVDLTTALRLGVAAHTLDAKAESRAGLVAGLLQRRDALYLDTPTGHVTSTGASGRGGAVDEVAYSPSGRVLASAGADGSFTLWDVTNRARPLRLSRTPAGSGALLALGFAAKGKLLATGDTQGVVRLWDISRPGRPRQSAALRGHGKRVEALAVSPDGQTLLAATGGQDAVLWDISDGAEPRKLTRLESGSAGPVRAVAYSDEGATVIVSGDGDAPAVWDVRRPGTPVPLGYIPSHSAVVQSVAFAPGSRLVATAGDDGMVELWDLNRAIDEADQGVLASISAHPLAARDVAFSHDGQTLATAGADGSVYLWDVTRPSAPERVAAFTGHTQQVRSVAFSPDDQSVLSGGDDGPVALWDATAHITGHAVSVLSRPGGEAKTVDFGLQGHLLGIFQGEFEDRAELRDLSTPNRPRDLASLDMGGAWLWAAAFSTDRRLLATGTDQNETLLWDISDQAHPRRLARLPGLDGQNTAVAFQPHGPLLATATGDGRQGDASTILWDVSQPTAPRRLQKLPDGPVTSLTFSRDGSTLVTTTYGKAHIWQVTPKGRARHLAAFSDAEQRVETSALSADRRTVAIAETASQRVALYDVRDRSRPRRLAELPSTAAPVRALAFSPTDALLAVGAQDGSIVLWDITQRTHPRQLTELNGIRSGVTLLAFGPDGRHLAATEDGVDVAAGRTIVWDISRIAAVVTQPVQRACALAGRGLSRQEWPRYTDGLPYQNTCGSR